MTALEELWYGNIGKKQNKNQGATLQKYSLAMLHPFSRVTTNSAIISLIPRRVGDLLGHSTSQMTEMFMSKEITQGS